MKSYGTGTYATALAAAAPGLRWVIPACGIALLALFGVLYTTDTPLYSHVLTWFMSRPFSHPFIDWEWIPSAVECWQRGVDVYVDNTCYQTIAHGRHNYSPLWLRMTFLPYGARWVAPFGLGIGALFFASLAALPPPRRVAGFLVTALATFSSLTAFAVERANVDLIMFVLTVAAAVCWAGPLRWRLAGYGIIVLAGLLKFYPFVLLILALRERPRVFAGICAATLVTLAAFGLTFGDELRHISAVPGGIYFEDRFAAVNLPYGLSLIATGSAAPAALPRAVLLLLTLAAVLRAASLSHRLRLDIALAAMPKREAGLLVAGAVLICACFFAGQNIGYRAIMLLLTLPGLLWLASCPESRSGRGTFVATGCAVVLVMWALAIRSVAESLSGGAAMVFGHWLINELAWWWVVSVLLAVPIGFVRGSRIGREALARDFGIRSNDRGIPSEPSPANSLPGAFADAG